MKMSLPKIDWELIASACIVAAENPENLTEEMKNALRMTYWEIRYRIKNGING